MNLRHMLQGSSYWHSDLVNFSGRLMAFGIVSEDRWLPLVENQVTPKGIQIVALTSKADLQEEGEAMKHCVWSYTNRCVENSHIFSIRDKSGTRLSTLHLIEIEKDGKIYVEINENNGVKNARAPNLAIEAGKWLEKGINQGRIRPDFAAIEAHRVPLRAKLAGLILGFDYKDLHVCEQVFQLFIPCLPTKLRASSKSSVGFLRAIGMDKFMAKYEIPLEAPQREDIVQMMKRLTLSKE